MGKTTSTTEEDSNFVERLTGSHHYETTISDGNESVTGLGRTSEESQGRASEKWGGDSSSESSGGGCYLTTACESNESP